MGVLDNSILKLNIILSKISTDTDPLKEMSKNGKPDEYTKHFFSTIYQVVLIVFIAGVAITALVLCAKLIMAKDGKGRNEVKGELVGKFFLVIIFFTAIPLIGVLVNALLKVIK